MKLIHTVRQHHAERAVHRQLRRELAAYSTPADIDDLMATVQREEDSAEVRAILDANLRDYYRRTAC